MKPINSSNASLSSVIQPFKMSWLRVIGLVAAFLFAATLFYMMRTACYMTHAGDIEVKESLIDVIILTLGVACGWLAGTISSPAAASEWARFVQFGTAIGTFLSGYVLSKSEKLINQVLTLSTWRMHEEASFRVLVWITGFLLSLMVTYMLRTSLLPPSVEDEHSQALAEARTQVAILEEVKNAADLRAKIAQIVLDTANKEAATAALIKTS